jgi:uncharacterized membrane protein
MANKIIKIFIQNFRFILKLSFLSIVLGILSLGILLPVFQCGFGYVFTKLKKGESVYFKNIFKFLNRTHVLLLLYLTLTIIFIVTIAGIFIPIFVVTFFMYAPYVVANENSDVLKAMQRSIEIVLKNGFFKHLLTAIILIIVFLIGLLPFGLGTFFTFPLISGYIGASYEEYKNAV